MRDSQLDRQMCFVCDYGLWILLVTLAVGAAAYLSRDYWLPTVPATAPTAVAPASTSSLTPTSVASTSIPISTQATTVASTTAIAAVTPTFTPPASIQTQIYINTAGGYSLIYQTHWRGEQVDSDAKFILTDGSKIEVRVRVVPDGTTLRSLTQDSGPIPTPNSKITDTTVTNQPTIQEDLLNSQGKVTARLYYILRGNKVYTLSIFSNPEGPLTTSFIDTLAQFENVVKSFKFIAQ